MMVRVRGAGVLLLLQILHTSARRNIHSAATPAETVLFNLLGGGRTHFLTLSNRNANTPAECIINLDNAAGTCKLLSECQAFQHLISDIRGNIEFFRSRVCRMTDENVFLCCPLTTSRLPTVTNIRLRQPPSTPSFLLPLSGQGGATGGRAPATDHRPTEHSLGFPVQPSSSPSLQPSRQPLQPSRLPFQPPQPGFNPQPTQPSSNFLGRPSQPSAFPLPSTRPLLGPDRKNDKSDGGEVLPGDREPGAQITPDPTIIPEKAFTIPPETECGTRSNTSLTRNPGYWPWLVSLGRFQGTQFEAICGGALITSRHVLAAAHCMMDRRINTPTHVRLGGFDRLNSQDTAPARDFAIATYVDPGYNNNTYQNDIAIITLSDVVTFNDLVQPVCLPFRFEYDGFRNQILDLVGLGPIITTGENRIQQVTQKNVNLSISGLDICKRTFRMYKTLVFDHNKMCASGVSRESCVSDKGALVFFYDEETTKKFFLVGLVSVGFGCTDPEKPGAYTRVGAHVPWIQQKLN